MVGLGRFELPTSPLSGVRSNQLSYRPGMLPDHKPGARFLFQVIEKSFEDQVNMLAGYAGRDHRSNLRKAEKARFRLPQFLSGTGPEGYMATSLMRRYSRSAFADA